MRQLASIIFALAMFVAFFGEAFPAPQNNNPSGYDSREYLAKAMQEIAKPLDRSVDDESVDPLVAESSNRLASLFTRAEMELRQLKTISNRAAVLNRNADPSEVEAHVAIDQQMVKGSQNRLQSLFRSADLEIQRLQTIATRGAEDEEEEQEEEVADMDNVHEEED